MTIPVLSLAMTNMATEAGATPTLPSGMTTTPLVVTVTPGVSLPTMVVTLPAAADTDRTQDRNRMSPAQRRPSLREPPLTTPVQHSTESLLTNPVQHHTEPPQSTPVQHSAGPTADGTGRSVLTPTQQVGSQSQPSVTTTDTWSSMGHLVTSTMQEEEFYPGSSQGTPSLKVVRDPHTDAPVGSSSEMPFPGSPLAPDPEVFEVATETPTPPAGLAPEPSVDTPEQPIPGPTESDSTLQHPWGATMVVSQPWHPASELRPDGPSTPLSSEPPKEHKVNTTDATLMRQKQEDRESRPTGAHTEPPQGTTQQAPATATTHTTEVQLTVLQSPRPRLHNAPETPSAHPDASSVATLRPPGMRIPGKHTVVVVPRGTVRPLIVTTPSPIGGRYVGTLQPWHPVTGKPRISVSPPWVWPEIKRIPAPKFPSMPPPWGPPAGSEMPRKGTNSATTILFQRNNELPDLAGSSPPAPRRPMLPAARMPSFPSPSWMPSTTPRPATPPPGRLNPSVHHRVYGQSIFRLDLGPPAPPWRTAATTSQPPSSRFFHKPPPSPAPRGPVTVPMPPAQPSRHGTQGGFKLPSPVGAPASQFWPVGEKPQIITKFPPTVSVTADGEVTLPCQATGKPEPLVTWTKVSTGALMAPNTRVGRFEVLKNSTLVIHGAQMQDRGQYLCMAQNLHGVDKRGVLLTVVLQQPHIASGGYQDVTVYLGDAIAMECLAQGTPMPQISWIFPDGRVWRTVSPVEGRVTLHENRTLSIRDASFSDRGVYKCVASNAAGADSLAIRLHVAALPPVIQQEKWENITVAPGLSIHVHCSAKAAPPPSVRWVLPDGMHVRPSQFVRGHFYVFPNGTLYIRNLAPRDSGHYECVAANLVGSVRRSVQLQVQRMAVNARITATSPKSTDVSYGATLRLDCSASGDPWPRIVWRLPSKQTVDALYSPESRVKVLANGTLQVSSVTERDAGDYLCVARNKLGDDFVALRVHVVTQPARIAPRDAGDHQVRDGAELRVDCVATGLPNPEISWGLPDGSLVNSAMQADQASGRPGGGRAKRYVVFHNGTLYFNEVGPAEEGDYTCFADNQVGRDEMRVRVRVLSAPAAIRDKTYSVLRVPYGDVAAVTCEAQGQPAPLLTWLSPSHRRIPTSSDKYRIDARGTLLIQKARRADSGNYTCVVRNRAGEDRKTVWLHVQVQPPTINGHPNAVTTVREVAAGGSRKLIDCRAEGVPPPRVLWAFPEGVVLPAPYYGNRITVHQNGTLDIRSLRPSDSVQLACIGRNEGGEARLLVQLTVLDALQKPTFHDPSSEKITALAGYTISLNCSAQGHPAPTLHWQLPNGTELRGGQRLSRFFHAADNGRLHISGLVPADAGLYRCVAHNIAGHAERLVVLKVGLSPTRSPPYRNLVSIAHGETLRLHCALPRSAGGGGVGGIRTGIGVSDGIPSVNDGVGGVRVGAAVSGGAVGSGNLGGIGNSQGTGGHPSLSWTLPSGLTLDSPHTKGRFSLLDNGTLIVRNASVFDRGTYTCKVDMHTGPVITSFPVIVIAYPPRITSEAMPVIYAHPGTSVKLNCMAVGLPKAELTWELPDGARLTTGVQARLFSHRLLHPQGTLTIQQVTVRDSGLYKCTARNVLGSDSKTTYVHVY